MKEVSNEEWFNPSDFDSNNDGYYDGVYFIYSVPIQHNYSSLWWAFSGEFKTSNYYKGIKLGKYVFAAAEFINPTSLDATTYIHETGHLLGLDDYYDYNDAVGPKGALGRTDMMENNIGDHSAFSKIILGWTNPIVVTDSSKITIDSLSKTGDVILVTNNFHDSVFDEYILIDVYDPTGINISQSEVFGYIYEPTLTKKGVRIYHIDSKLGSGSIYGAYYYYTLFAKNNSTTSSKIIKLIEKGNTNYIESNYMANNDMMFYHNDCFTQNYKYRLYNLELFKFTILITQNEDTSFTIDIKAR